MRPTVKQVMQLLRHIFERRKMKAAIRQTVVKRYMRRALCGTFILAGVGVGGIIGATVARVVGGAAGGLVGRWIESRQFKSIPQIISELTVPEQEELYQRVLPIIQNLGCSNMAEVKKLVMCNSDHENKFVKVLTDFITNKLNGEVKKG